VANECPRLRGIGPSNIAPPLVGTTRGVAQVAATTLFHGHVQYHTFLNNQGGQRMSIMRSIEVMGILRDIVQFYRTTLLHQIPCIVNYVAHLRTSIASAYI
jgi:hypothetical protein